jgi:pimeloyl-ACP methyl ester carboxylesterase
MKNPNRRSVAIGLLTTFLSAGVPQFSRAGSQPHRQLRLLEPDRLKDPLPSPTVVSLKGTCLGTVSYVRRRPQSNSNVRPVLYMHGYGGDYRSALPPEYLLSDLYDLYCVHRPGYGATQNTEATSLEWQIDGNSFGPGDTTKRPGARETAKIAAALMDTVLAGIPQWQVVVVGTSGGCPAALAFASLFPTRTRALILQAGVSLPWRREEYVPKIFRQLYRQAIASHDNIPQCKNSDTGKQRYCEVTATLSDLLQKKLNGKELNTHEKWIKALVGVRRPLVASDPAGDPLMMLEAPDPPHIDPLTISGAINDYFTLFRFSEDFCDWHAIQAPTLIVHDAQDPFVPYCHAQQAAARIRDGSLRLFTVGGHMVWLGTEARKMHETRLRFLRKVGWYS